MTTPKEIQDLMEAHSQRLHELKKQQALSGIGVDPKITLEIKKIEAELQALQAELSAFTAPDQPAFPEAPLIHIHNWGRPPNRWPEAALAVFDWSGPGKFEELPGGSRRPPLPEVWQRELWPQLAALPNKVGEDSLIRLEGKCALSTGFALGRVFNAKDRYQLEVAQYVPDKGRVEYWYSGARPPGDQAAPQFASRMIPGAPAAGESSPVEDDGLIVINALTGKPTAGVLADVGRYFGRAEAFGRLLTEETLAPGVKGLLVLEATAATRGNRPLEGWEAAALAQTSRQRLTAFKQQISPARLHLFMALPLGLAVFLGHFWNNLHLTVQCYEEDRTEKFYAPTCLLSIS